MHLQGAMKKITKRFPSCNKLAKVIFLSWILYRHIHGKTEAKERKTQRAKGNKKALKESIKSGENEGKKKIQER